MRKEGVSAKTDQLASDLLGSALDQLAEGPLESVLLVVEDAQGSVASYNFSDDGIEALLDGAYHKVRELVANSGSSADGLVDPVRYALSYMGGVANDEGEFEDALLLEFGESGYLSYSAYSYVEGIGEGDNLTFSEPAAAGEVEPLI